MDRTDGLDETDGLDGMDRMDETDRASPTAPRVAYGAAGVGVGSGLRVSSSYTAVASAAPAASSG